MHVPSQLALDDNRDRSLSHFILSTKPFRVHRAGTCSTPLQDGVFWSFLVGVLGGTE